MSTATSPGVPLWPISAAAIIVLGTMISLKGCDMSDKDNDGISPTRVVGKAIGRKESYRPVRRSDD